MHTFSWTEKPFTGLGFQNNIETKTLIFLLHGYMGDAPSNSVFAKKIAENVPDATVIVPNGLTLVPSLNNPVHRQWWDLPDDFVPSCLSCFSDKYPEKQKDIACQMLPRIHFTAGVLNRFILRTATNFGKKISDCAVIGISQGGITAWDMLLYRKELTKKEALGALIVIGAGMFFPERELSDKNAVHTPIMIAGGNNDAFFGPKVNDFSESVLLHHGFSVSRVQTQSVHFGLEHTVTSPIIDFLNENFPKKERVP